MFVGDLEKIVAIQFSQGRSSLIEDKIDKLAPPIFVVVVARPVDRFATRHCFPGDSESTIKLARIEFQSDFIANERVMVSDSARKMKQSPGCVEKDRFYRCLFVVCKHERAQSMESRFPGPCNFCCGRGYGRIFRDGFGQR